VQELITYLAKALVDEPDQVQLREVPAVEGGGKVLELKVAPGDVGKVIGRDGRTVNAMRTLLAVAAQKKGEKIRLEIVDDRKVASGAQAVVSAAEPVPE